MTRSLQFRTKLDLTYGLIKIKLDKLGHILEAEEENRFRMKFFFHPSLNLLFRKNYRKIH